MLTEGLVKVTLVDGNRGTHGIVGPITKMQYGYRKHGDHFFVKQADATVMVRGNEVTLFTAVAPVPSAPATKTRELAAVHGVNEERLALLLDNGVTTLIQLAESKPEVIVEYLNISHAAAARLINGAIRALADGE